MSRGWDTIPLEALCSFRAGLWESDKGPLRRVSVVRNTNFTRSGELDFSDVANLDVEERSFLKRRLSPGDIILEKSGGGPKQAVGRVCLFSEPEGEFSFSNFTAALTVKDRSKLEPRYLLRFLMWCYESGITETMQSHSTGIRNLDGNAYKNIGVPIPPLAEQQRIVAILDEAFEGIDAAIANADRAAVNGTALFEAARKSLFSNRESSWKDQPIAAICENLDGRRRPVTKRDRVPGDVPYYGASGVVDHVQSKLFDEDLLLVSEDGANLLARTYPIAFSIIGPSWVNNHAHVLRFADARTQRFVEHFFNSIDLGPYVTGMAQPKLNQGALNKILVPLPPLDRQGDIVASLERLQSATNNLLDLRSRKLTLLSELKQSLLAHAFSGELIATTAPISNNGDFATAAQAANILAFMYWQHERASRGRFFGHVMGQKALDLVERVGCVDLGREPYKDAAGPNDRAHMAAAERWAKQQAFFEFVERSGGGYDFKKLSNHSAMLAAAKTALKPVEVQMARVTDILVGKDKVEAEVFDTVLAAWNNLVADSMEASDAAIIYEARENWHPDKLTIPISKFHSAIQEIRQRGLVPNGTAKVVRHRQASLL